MALSISDFREQFPAPAFELTSDAEITRALYDALLLHSINETATLYCAAHLLALKAEYVDELGRAVDTPDGGSGVVKSEKLGPRQIQYMTMAGDDERRVFYATTPYGRMFLALEARVPRVAFGVLTA